jgi:hypothetical protein
MGNLGVLTGTQGEIRRALDCASVNWGALVFDPCNLWKLSICTHDSWKTQWLSSPNSCQLHLNEALHRL